MPEEDAAIEKQFSETKLEGLDAIHTLVFEGGGGKGHAYPYVLQALIDKGLDLSRIQKVAGTSVGAIVACLLAMNLTPDEILKELARINLDLFLNKKEFWPIKLIRFLFLHGLNSQKKLSDWYKDLLTRYSGDPNITFKEFSKLSRKGLPFKDLVMTTTYVGARKNNPKEVVAYTILLSKELSPDTRIVDALRMSTCLPWIFTPLRGEISPVVTEEGVQSGGRFKAKWFSKNPFLVDGGLTGNNPFEHILERDEKGYLLEGEALHAQIDRLAPHTLSFVLMEPPLRQTSTAYEAGKVSTGKQQLLDAQASSTGKTTSHVPSYMKDRTIFIQFPRKENGNSLVGTTDFSLDPETARRVELTAKQAVINFARRTERVRKQHEEQVIGRQRKTEVFFSTFPPSLQARLHLSRLKPNTFQVKCDEPVSSELLNLAASISAVKKVRTFHSTHGHEVVEVEHSRDWPLSEYWQCASSSGKIAVSEEDDRVSLDSVSLHDESFFDSSASSREEDDDSSNSTDRTRLVTCTL